MNKMVVVRDLWKSYGAGSARLEILTGLSLAIDEGEMVAVTGVSGSGKSTLLHLLGGMDRPDRGSILVRGEELLSMAPRRLSEYRNRTIGFVFQFHHLLPEFNALENVMMPLLLGGAPRAGAAERAGAFLAEVGLEGREGHRPGELSGGEQQRVAVARALAGNPALLLADEPTGNLDPHTGEALGTLLRRLHDSHGLTSLLVTHNERLARICNRVCSLVDGRLA